MPELPNFKPDPSIRCREFKIGCIGAGFIMADVQLSAYATAGFPVVAIASRRAEKAAEVAQRWQIPSVHQTPRQLIENPNVEIVDIAFPPDQQPELIRHALGQKHVRGILAQKPKKRQQPIKCCPSTRTCDSINRCAF
jgi:predicted dehydrogenase